jgi:succinate dehydrogenase / fumarate reductase flavoprotein subunit
MQDLVGIVRQEGEMRQALEHIKRLKAEAERAGISGHREFNAGWHTALDLGNLLTVSEIVTLAALDRKESRGGHFRDDYPNKDAEYAKFNIVAKRAPDGGVQLTRVPIAEMRPDLKQIIEEMK